MTEQSWYDDNVASEYGEIKRLKAEIEKLRAALILLRDSDDARRLCITDEVVATALNGVDNAKTSR
jgi:hypothetical protein